jgi:hypothetical protein
MKHELSMNYVCLLAWSGFGLGGDAMELGLIEHVYIYQLAVKYSNQGLYHYCLKGCTSLSL